jgi:HK97 family phage portal protein
VKSGIRRLRNATAAPPVQLSRPGTRRGLSYDLGSGRGSRLAQLRAYGRSGTVFSIVSLLQSSAATPRWHLYKKAKADGRVRYTTGDKGTDNRVEVVQHAAIKLWSTPNPYQSGFEFREGSNQHLELAGETFWVLNRENPFSLPTAMWYVRPDRMEPVPNPDGWLLGWIYSSPSGEQVPLDADMVILEKTPDPLDPFRGMSPVASVMANIEQQDYATQYQRNLFLNGATPGGIIQVPTSLSEPEWNELVDRWREGHQGVARAGRVGVLENGATWAGDAPTNKDLEYGNLRLANRDELREAWRIHKHMLGTVDDVNRANAETAEDQFVGWQDIPRLERRKDTLNYKLLPMFGDDTVEFDFEDPSNVNQDAANAEMTAKANAVQTLINSGLDPHAALEWAGIPDMEVVEKATQQTALPPGWVPGQPAVPPAPDNAPAQGDMAALLRRVLSDGYVPVEMGRR